MPQPQFVHLENLDLETSAEIFKVTVAVEGFNGGVDIGLAFCSSKDQFCRRTGRVKALGRARGAAQKHYYRVYDVEDLPSFLKVEPVIKIVQRALDYVSSQENAV